jgi:hypothetical protein
MEPGVFYPAVEIKCPGEIFDGRFSEFFVIINLPYAEIVLGAFRIDINRFFVIFKGGVVLSFFQINITEIGEGRLVPRISKFLL